ncbi:hypothetical protein, partial [Mesorhizobium sp. M1A.F.Ca.IN.020.04.1.1]|uniref:hypothetical protein n=1 Tax=Mesorhizobium sp. M1A.F.Ca.IN.020.04.1.1 TaxID=2496761 RepID=UPI0019D1AD76
VAAGYRLAHRLSGLGPWLDHSYIEGVGQANVRQCPDRSRCHGIRRQKDHHLRFAIRPEWSAAGEEHKRHNADQKNGGEQVRNDLSELHAAPPKGAPAASQVAAGATATDDEGTYARQS